MRPFSAGKGSQLQAFWVKLPFLCLIAATLAFAMVVLIAPLMSTREAKISADDPSRQVVPPEIEEEVIGEAVRESVPPKIEKEVVREMVPPKIEEEVAPPNVEEDQATTSGSNASQVLQQRPWQQGKRIITASNVIWYPWCPFDCAVMRAVTICDSHEAAVLI